MTFGRTPLLEKIYRHPIIPVFYHDNIETACRVMKACYEGGIKVFEFTQRGENAFEVFKKILDYRNNNYSDMFIGVGSILTAADTELYIAAGVDFIVSPVLKPEMAEVCKKHNKLWIPGCATLTEIHNAELLGATLIKLFPGNVIGTDFVKAVLGPMPWLQLMPTGGVEPTEESLQKWFNAGVKCVGMGSQLIDKKTIESGNYTELTNKIKTLITWVEKNRS